MQRFFCRDLAEAATLDAGVLGKVGP